MPIVSTGGALVPGLGYDRKGAADLNVQYPVTTIAGDGAIVVTSGIVVFTKGSAAAISLRASTVAEVGTRLTLYAGSAFAHVVTATGLIDDGVTGGSKTTLTFGAFVGASITLIAAQAGKWGVESKNVVVIT